jgi:hypothetical protein
MRAGVLNVHKSHLWTRDNPHHIRERVGIHYAPALAFGPELSWTLSWAPVCNWCRDYLKNCYTRAVSAWRSPTALWGASRSDGTLHNQEKWTERRGPIAWPPLSPDLTMMDIALWGIPEGARLCTTEDAARLQAVVITADATMSVRKNECTHYHLSWNGRRPLRTPTVTTRHPWFDRLMVCISLRWSVHWKLTVTAHMMYNICDWLLTRNHTRDGLCENFLSLCI